MSAPAPAVIVKIGGSLLGSRRLDRVIRAIVEAEDANIVIVPGGGPFADAVREAQAEVGFGDALAHRLALAAMGQMADIMADRHPALAVAATVTAIRAVWRDGRVPVWDPAELRAGHAAIPECWDVTSDSLAAWLAAALDADRLVLVKSTEPPPGTGPQAWSACGLIDPAFPTFASRARAEIVVAGPASDDTLAMLLMGSFSYA